MPLETGRQLGPYQIQAPLGAGGMGEVYKARDTRLDRTVAIKVLPEHVASDPDLKQRFEREAKTVAALSHPHICPVFDVGDQDGVNFLVMEYLEGQTLAQRLEKGALPLDQALIIAIEIADALDKAHRQGIVHRDLKPGNIMLTKAGAKLLDFGLAKLKQPGGAAAGLSALPTQSAGQTGEGKILGTLQYMAPEQLEGKDADARTDIFAFGTMVYETATGKKAFEGTSQASLIHSIMGVDPPPVSLLQSMTPPALDRLVKTCLSKDPEDRWQSARDVYRELKWIAEAGAEVGVPVSTPAAPPQVGWGRRAMTLALGMLIVGSLMTGLAMWSVTRPEPPRVVRFAVSPDEAAPLHIAAISPDIAIAPDGEHIAYLTGSVGFGGERLHVRPLRQLTSEPLVEEGELNSPFFSPDSATVAFYDRSPTDVLKPVPVQGGPVSTICELPGDLRGASWGADGTIVFAASDTASGLWRVSAGGGEPEQLTTPDTEHGELDHLWPEILPGGRAVLFTIVANPLEESQIAVLSLDTGEKEIIIRGGSYPRYSPTRHLLYAAQGTLRAVGFDLNSLDTVGDAVPVQEGIIYKRLGGAMNFSVSENGSLVYIPFRGGGRRRTLVWVDREGQEEPVPAEPRSYGSPRLSPDGRKVAVVAYGRNTDVVVYDLLRDTPTRLTFDEAIDNYPVWTRDGGRVVFTSLRHGGALNLWWKVADGTGEVERLSTGSRNQYPRSWSGDGQTLVFVSARPGTGRDVALLSLEGERQESC